MVEPIVQDDEMLITLAVECLDPYGSPNEATIELTQEQITLLNKGDPTDTMPSTLNLVPLHFGELPIIPKFLTAFLDLQNKEKW